ncbi:MAG: asparagine synthase (glutamine-hydrolyzing) [Alteromonadaceae bacterium]|jgi:asparagine synthase (glutamine-hydrolysing)
MCGIAGIINLDGKTVEAGMLDKMKELLRHRGPDGAGSHLQDNVGLVHTRLSIQDLTDSAHQPMKDEDSGCWLTYNGEIYNFRVLRQELVTRGIALKSSGDTEVLLKYCVHFGVNKTLSKLNGMFSFAFWNNKTKELWLARDRMGIKPFYYIATTKSLMFASEMKVLLPFLDRVEPDHAVLHEVLNGRTPWEPYTLFAGIKALEPGNYIHITSAEKRILPKEYFSIFANVTESEYKDNQQASVEDINEKFLSLMKNSVSTHSVSDAPIGALLSGGIDSSLISSLAKKHNNDLSLYHADVVGPQSEKIYAQQVAEYLNLTFIDEPIDKFSYASELVATTYFHEAPSAYHPNDVPFQLIAKRAKKDGIKVLLTGEGADELFIGYKKATAAILRDKLGMFCHKVPGGSRIGRVINKLNQPNEEFLMSENFASRGSAATWQLRAEQAYHFISDPVEKNALVNSFVFLKAHLNSLLQRNDRMGMMHGIESRIPFLENELVRFAANLPLKFKSPSNLMALLTNHSATKNKKVVRNAALGLVPPSIVTRRKVGFPITPSDYFNIEDHFFLDGFLQHHLRVNNKELTNMLANLSAKQRWRFFSTEIFGRLFFLGDDKETLSEKVNEYIK